MRVDVKNASYSYLLLVYTIIQLAFSIFWVYFHLSNQWIVTWHVLYLYDNVSLRYDATPLF